MIGSVVHLWNFGTGSATATVDLGSSRPFLAWGSITFTDSLAVYDRDNGSAIEVYQVDGVTQWRAGATGATIWGRPTLTATCARAASEASAEESPSDSAASMSTISSTTAWGAS